MNIATRLGLPGPEVAAQDRKQLQREKKKFFFCGHPFGADTRYQAISIESTQVNGMKASVMKKLSNSHQAPKASPQRLEWAQDKGSKLEPFYIAAIGSDRRSLARAMKFDQRR